jgi:streptogramin lyase
MGRTVGKIGAMAAVTLFAITVVPNAQGVYAATGTWTNITNGGSFNAPLGIAVNAGGDVFVANSGNNTVEELPSGSTTWKTIPGTFDKPADIAVDSHGDLFVTNEGNNTVEELPSGSSTWVPLPSGSFDQPWGIAVDSQGDVFVANNGNNTVEELPSGSSTWTSINGPFDMPQGIAVDGQGDLFVVNNANAATDAVIELPSGSNTWKDITPPGSQKYPNDVAVDAAGDIYVTYFNATTNAVEELPAGSSTWISLADGQLVNYPEGIAVSNSGAVYVSNFATNTMAEYAVPWTPPVLAPESVTIDGIQAEVIGSLGYNPPQAVEGGSYVGYVEERAAVEAGASYNGEGIDSSYLSAILDGSGVGLQQHVSATEQGQFAALYQSLGIIPTWTDNTVNISQGVKALIHAGASTLAIENYLVQLDGYSWAQAQAQAQEGFPMQGP